MTSVAVGHGRNAKGLVLSGDPFVQLLPPAVRDRAKNRSFRRLMVLLLVLSVAIVAAGVAFGLFRTVQSQTALDAANAETARLLGEQEIYRADAAVADVVANTLAAQQMVTATEVDWQALYEDIDERLGSRGDITGISFSAGLPWAAAPAGSQFAPPPSVTVEVTVQSSSVLRLAEISDRFATIPGIQVVQFSAASRANEDGDFVTTMSLAFDEQRFLGRYAPAEPPAEPPAGESAAGDGTEEGAP